MEKLTHFNQEIQITVSVDSIAAKLLEAMNPQNPHAILIVNTIIGQAIANDRKNDIGRLYNVLSGFDSVIDFKEGQKLYCSESVYDYKNDGSYNPREMGVCKVIEINALRDHRKVKVEYKKYFKPDTTQIEKTWVKIEDLREIVESDIVDHEPEQNTGE